MCSDCGKLSAELNDDLLSNLLSSVDRSLRLLFANFCFIYRTFLLHFYLHVYKRFPQSFIASVACIRSIRLMLAQI